VALTYLLLADSRNVENNILTFNPGFEEDTYANQ
jgi:hypothetical protein